MATLMRRTEVVIWAPILSSFSRRLRVFHLTAGTVSLLIEGLRGVVVGRQGGDHEAGIGATGQDLGFGHHPTLSGPALQGAEAKVGEAPDRLLMLVREGFGLGQLGADGFFQAGIAGQTEQIVHLIVLTPGHQRLSGKAGVGPQQDLDLRSGTAQAGDDALDLFEGTGGGIDVGGSQQGAEQMAGAEDVEGQVAVAPVIAMKEPVLLLPVEGIVGGV